MNMKIQQSWHLKDFQSYPYDVRFEFFKEHWGSSEMIISSGIYQCVDLQGIVLSTNDDKWKGLITYLIKGQELEIISLDALEEGIGIGTLLIKNIEEYARQHQISKITLITTNDNINAIAFYQKKGYRLENIYPNAVEKARQLKPSIPTIAENGIPIRDELLFVKHLQ